jgi:hypothetical protein
MDIIELAEIRIKINKKVPDGFSRVMFENVTLKIVTFQRKLMKYWEVLGEACEELTKQLKMLRLEKVKFEVSAFNVEVLVI